MSRFNAAVGQPFHTSFMDGRALGWRAFPEGGLGLKLRFNDLALSAALHELSDGKTELKNEYDRLYLTFHETATLICEWFNEPAVAEMQIALLRNLLLCRGTDQYILKLGSIQPRKCDHDAFIRNLVLPVAENAPKIRKFVQTHHAQRLAQPP